MQIFPNNLQLEKALRGPEMLCHSECGLEQAASASPGAAKKCRLPILDPVDQNLHVTRFPGDQCTKFKFKKYPLSSSLSNLNLKWSDFFFKDLQEKKSSHSPFT